MATFSKLLLPYGLGQPTPLFESGGCVRIYLLCTVVPIDGLVFRCNDACTRITLYCMPRFCYSIRFWQRQCISDPLLNRQHSADGHVSPNCRARNSSWLVASFFCFFFCILCLKEFFQTRPKMLRPLSISTGGVNKKLDQDSAAPVFEESSSGMLSWILRAI